MTVLCWMNTTQYSARRLSVHKLFTSCIRRCLVSRACDWVMSALSAVLLIYSIQSKPAFLPCRSARRHSGVLGLPDIGHWAGILQAASPFCHWINSIKALMKTQSTDPNQSRGLIVSLSTTRLLAEAALLHLSQRSNASTKIITQLEEASTHKSRVSMTHDLDLWPQHKWVYRTHRGTFLSPVWWF